ncbi:MAG: pentapeptide repeat-containing protein, partial [Waterburya sp.]
EDADLCNTDLRGAKLMRANFRNAKLSQADIKGADIKDANLAELPVSLDTNKVKLAINWEYAKYEPSFREKLGLKNTGVTE